MMLDKMIVREIPCNEVDMEIMEMSDDEDQAVRFACGFVIRAVKKKMAKDKKYAVYVEVLETMHDDVIDSDDFFTYSTEWISLIDRRGLYKVSDEVFLLFRWMETIMRRFLTGRSVNIGKAIAEIMNSDNVLQCWSLICTTLEPEESDILLSKLTELWVTIRGFSYAGNLLEQYKQSAKTSTKKKSLRKSLKLDTEKANS